MDQIIIDVQNLFSVLAPLLVLAIIMEQAMSPIFKSRFFQDKLAGKGWKLPIVLLFSLMLLAGHDVHISGAILSSSKGGFIPSAAAFADYLLAALLLTGGSAGINSLISAIKNIRVKQKSTV